jgi:hypothetical protein
VKVDNTLSTADKPIPNLGMTDCETGLFLSLFKARYNRYPSYPLIKSHP